MQRRSGIGRWMLPWLAVAAFISASSAFAATYETVGTIPGLGSAHVVSYSLEGQAGSAYAVGFDSKLDGVSGVSFCGDLLHTINVPGAYDANPIDLSSLSAGYGTAAKIAQRWSFDLGSLGSNLADGAAGVQLAIWETIYGASFTITSSLGSGTLAAYQTVLGTDYSNAGVGDTVFLDVTKSGQAKQDHFFTPDGPATPEPGAALLFAAGLVVVARGFRREPA